MKLIDVVQRLKLVNDYNQCKDAMNDAITEIESLRKANTELQVSNKRLRDGIAEIAVEAQDTYTNAALTKLLSATQAQSLIEHDNEVLERAAKVCDRYHYIPDAAPYDCAKAIRALKEVK